MHSSTILPHNVLFGQLRFGSWLIDIFAEPKTPADLFTETFLVCCIGSRLRVAVVDPALHERVDDAEGMAIAAWGETQTSLRTMPDPSQALRAANATIRARWPHSWMRTPLLCVGVVDVDITAPTNLSAARTGDTELWCSHRSHDELVPVLSGSCFTTETDRELRARRARVAPGDPARWDIQTEYCTPASYTTHPLGLVDHPVIETYQCATADTTIVATDGIPDRLIDASPHALAAVCATPSGKKPSPHGDRTRLVLRWAPLQH